MVIIPKLMAQKDAKNVVTDGTKQYRKERCGGYSTRD